MKMLQLRKLRDLKIIDIREVFAAVNLSAMTKVAARKV